MSVLGRAAAFFFALHGALSPALSRAQPTLPATSAVAAVPQVSATSEPDITEYRLSPEKAREAARLYRIRKVLYATRITWGIAALLLLLELRIGARYRDWAEAVGRRSLLQAAVFVPLISISLGILNLPLGIYGHHLQMAYGFSVQGWPSWLWDWTKGQFIEIVLMTPLTWGFYAILRHAARRWWLLAWAGAVPVVVMLVFLQPLVIDPIFNKFEPLEVRRPVLAEQIEKVVHRAGLEIPRSRMFEMRASEKVTTYNAYVTGIGASKRVVVWDTTARDLPLPQILFIFGHEQAHYVLNHIWIGVGATLLGLLLCLWIAHRAIGFLLTLRGARWGIRGVSDWASLPALLLLASAMQFLAEPVGAGLSRCLEHQADIYALEIIHDLVPDSSQAAARAFQRLGEKALAVPNPDPLFVFWTSGHPPIAERIRFALAYRPWSEGRRPRYIQ
ncbi:MAG TPA: M48 family metallopeptidase [Verrucomicrobiae bacterium]|nr:M48 family metallopeptidase [Verrucomicrobiae bacterium]